MNKSAMHNDSSSSNVLYVMSFSDDDESYLRVDLEFFASGYKHSISISLIGMYIPRIKYL